MQNKVMLIVIIVLLVILVSSVAAFAFFFMRTSKTEAEAEVEQATPVVYLNEDEMDDISLGDALRTNLATSADGSEHFISVNISVSVNNTVKKESPAMLALVNEKVLIARSVALGVIRKKTQQELRRPDGKEILEDEILTKLQEQFNTNLIVRVSVTDMVLN